MKLLFYIFAIAAIVLIRGFWFLKDDFPVNDSFYMDKYLKELKIKK